MTDRPARSGSQRPPKHASPISSGPGLGNPVEPEVSSNNLMQILRGIAVSPGVAIGPPLIVDPKLPLLPQRQIPPATIPAEVERLDRGLEATRRDAEAAEAEARRRLEPQYADILAAHTRMVTDPSLRRDARRKIEQDQISAEHAVFEVLDDYANRLERLGVAHLSARAADVLDIRRRILDRLLEQPPEVSLEEPVEPVVLLATDLSPSQTAALEPERVLGFATEAGGRTSHTAIVAAALEIPAVVGLGRFLHLARRCQGVIIDGDEGLVVLDPDPETLKRYRKASADRAAQFAGLASLANLPAETLDGHRVGLLGNIEFPAEVQACHQRGATGIGLYRTEFLYLSSEKPPTEDEQSEAYASVVRSLPGRPVTIRTLDLGADKSTSRDGPAEANPSLGLRSLRRSLRDPVCFRTQLRAILRASVLGDVRIMFPLVSTLDEFRRARAILNDVANELAAEGVSIRSDVPVGAMIEVPAAAIMADLLAKEVDFFSIGTNDLIQYTLAADRTNENVAELYNAADPAVIRLIDRVVQAAHAATIEVTVCGSMAGEPLYTMLLLGLGVHHLSTPPHQLPLIKRVIRAIHLKQAQQLAQEALNRDSAAGVLQLLRETLARILPDALFDTSSEEQSQASSIQESK